MVVVVVVIVIVIVIVIVVIVIVVVVVVVVVVDAIYGLSDIGTTQFDERTAGRLELMPRIPSMLHHCLYIGLSAHSL